MNLSPSILLVAAAFLGLVFGLAGGYGGRWLFALGVRRELNEFGAELEGFSDRIKKLEGRAAQRQRAPSEQAPKEIGELVALLQQRRGPAGFVPLAQGEETEAQIVARAFAHAPTKVEKP